MLYTGALPDNRKIYATKKQAKKETLQTEAAKHLRAPPTATHELH